ncbi:hypothetical protein CGCF413_v002763 [Colletotrichum fructicola]|nr:hypothetical protein CGCF413_v002763 [Colletotrichum fructicola]
MALVRPLLLPWAPSDPATESTGQERLCLSSLPHLDNRHPHSDKYGSTRDTLDFKGCSHQHPFVISPDSHTYPTSLKQSTPRRTIPAGLLLSTFPSFRHTASG